MKSVKQAANKLDGEEENLPPPTTDLFGKWQCDPWRPPRAVNGIVPKARHKFCVQKIALLVLLVPELCSRMF